MEEVNETAPNEVPVFTSTDDVMSTLMQLLDVTTRVEQMNLRHAQEAAALDSEYQENQKRWVAACNWLRSENGSHS